MSSDPNERTLIHRPAAAAPRASSTLDARQIGALAAINPIVAAANPLLMVIASLRHGAAPANVEALRARLIDMVREFDTACERAQIPEDQRHLARYALCTVVDETVQRTSWSGNANWARQSLLIHNFRENWGGEKFFQILDKLVEAPTKFAWLLQLFYVCLSLGFMGRFLLQEGTGRQAAADLRERLYNLIRQGSPEVERALSPRWQGLSVAARQFKGFTLMWLTVAGMALLCLIVFVAYAFKLASYRDELGLGQLAIKKSPPTQLAMAPPARPRLVQLLAAEIQARQLKVDENALESRVTLVSELAFDSGSAVPTSAVMALLDRVAWAMDQVEGRVLVSGHTDNVPTRTLQFPSNFELSKARARAVTEAMKLRLKDPNRISYEGRGDSEPVAPNTSAEGRAQNRRVEITLRVSNAGGSV